MDKISAMIRGLINAGWTQMGIQQETGIPQHRVSKWMRHGAPRPVEDGLKLLALVESGKAPPHPRKR